MNTLTDPQGALGFHYQGDDGTPEGTYLTGEEAATEMNMSRTWFYERIAPLVKMYAIPTYRRRFFRKEDLDQYRGLRK